MTILNRDQFLQLVGALIEPSQGHARAENFDYDFERASLAPPGDGNASRWPLENQHGFVEPAGRLVRWIVQRMALVRARLRRISPGLPAAYLPVLREPITLSAEQGLNFVQRELAGLSSFFRFDHPSAIRASH